MRETRKDNVIKSSDLPDDPKLKEDNTKVIKMRELVPNKRQVNAKDIKEMVDMKRKGIEESKEDTDEFADDLAKAEKNKKKNR